MELSYRGNGSRLATREIEGICLGLFLATYIIGIEL